MRRTLSIYSYAAPAVILPLSYWLWWRSFGDHGFVATVLSMPIVFAYVVPGLGTNWLGLWELNTGWRLGKFRPHHGFVFGAATSLLALVCVERSDEPLGAWELFRAALVMGSVLALWNWWYDAAAIRAGLLVVYNKPYSEGRGPEAIAADYAPAFFGAFGACYGAAVRVCRHCYFQIEGFDSAWTLALACNAATLVLPVALFIGYYYLRTGETGLKRYTRPEDRPQGK